MYNHAYSYNVNPQKRRFCSDAQGTPITELPTFYFGERPVFTMTFPDNVLTEGEKLVFVMDNENRFLDSHSITGLEPVMAWCIHEITAEDVENKSIELELYCFSRKYADVINGHDNAVTCTLSLFIKSIDENLKCTFSTLATTLAYAEPTIVSPDCVFNDLPIDMYLTRDEMNALIAEVEALQREAIEKAEQARQSAAVAEAAAQEASQIAHDLKPLQLDAPPTTSTGGSVGQLATWHDAENNKDHLYHLVFVSTSDSATLYHWEECVLVSMGNVAGGYPILGADGKVTSAQLPIAQTNTLGLVMPTQNYGMSVDNAGHLITLIASENDINTGSYYRYINAGRVPYAVRSVLPKVTKIPAATSDYSLVDSSATTLNHSHTFVHTPANAPTYRLPSVSDTTVSHYIELTVDFTNVQTYSFLDANGDALVPLFTPSIAAGDVYTFKMEYSAIKAKWLIYPQKQGSVADDFVTRGEVGAANGVAGLDSNAKVPSTQLPIASSTARGTIKVMPVASSGLGIQNTDELYIIYANNTDISNRIHQRKPIVPANLNYAVTAALTDSNKISLTDAQKAAAQEVFGVGGDLTGTGAPTTSTVGKVMDRYLDTATGKTYTCTAVNVDDTDPQNPATTYTWVDDINANGGTFAKHVHVGNNILLNSYGTLSVGFNTYVTGYAGSLAVGSFARALRGSGCTCIGFYAFSTQDSQFVAGKANAQLNGARLTGGGTSNANRRNIEELSWDGDLLIAGGHQQEITNIPSNTTEYALKEGVQRHVPALASVYRLPEVHARCIIAGGSWCRHEDSYDGAGYYGWVTTFSSSPTSWNERVYYTANRYPSATEKAYSNTALTSGKTAITLPPDITHECILTIKFSASVLTYEFQDSAGNTLVPLPLNGDIEDGSVVSFLCRYESLLSQWVIMPVMVGKEAQA